MNIRWIKSLNEWMEKLEKIAQESIIHLKAMQEI